MAHPVGDIPLDQAAMIEPLSVSYHAVKYAGVKQGDTVLIGGAGPIGLFAAAVASAFGATVIISELSAARRQKALDTGVADHVLDPRMTMPSPRSWNSQAGKAWTSP